MQMKLISYAHCNRDVRLAWHEAATAKQKEQLQQQQQQYTTHGNHDSKHSGSSSSKASPPRIRYDVSIMVPKENYANSVMQSTLYSCKTCY
jgi:CRISPR/Cas system-associated protein Cas7 (RAMP superfamily)